jgi:recombination associated protein RdgC
MLYRIGAGWTASIKQIEAALNRNQFIECSAAQERSMGWVAPRGQQHGALVESVTGQLILKFVIETKLLPSSVVKRLTQQKMDKIEATTGRRPGKKQARELKDDAIRELLPLAFTKQSPVTVWIDPKARLLVLDTTSQSKADEVMTALIRALDGFTVTLLQTKASPNAAMSQWLTERQAPGRFDLDRECELKSTDDMQSSVKYSRHVLEIAEIGKHVESGKVPTRLAMFWDGKISFLLTDTLQIKKIRFLDGVFKEAGGQDANGQDEDRFDADTAIATGEMSKLLPDLIEALGGEAVVGVA